ncbi:MAG: pseudouridine synthase, partial [Planctomycetota bacterium]
MLDPSKPFDLTYRVDPTHDGMRLDRYVHAMAPTISRTRVKRYNAEGRIRLNDAVRPDNARVRTGDAVLLQCREPAGGIDVARDIPVEIVYEDEHLLAVNKQPGLVVHPVALHRHDTLMNALYFLYEDRLPAGRELSLVNRIDKLTSGIVLVAKGLEAKRHLQEQFEARTPYKTYLAVARGVVDGEQGEIALPIGPKADCANRCVQAVRRDSAGKPCLTRFWVRERFADRGVTLPDGTESRQGYTLVRFALATGRQHQIRVHAMALGHPLLG